MKHLQVEHAVARGVELEEDLHHVSRLEAARQQQLLRQTQRAAQADGVRVCGCAGTHARMRMLHRGLFSLFSLCRACFRGGSHAFAPAS